MVASYTKCKDTVTSIVGKNIFLLLPRTTIFQIQAKTINFSNKFRLLSIFRIFRIYPRKKGGNRVSRFPLFFSTMAGSSRKGCQLRPTDILLCWELLLPSHLENRAAFEILLILDLGRNLSKSTQTEKTLKTLKTLKTVQHLRYCSKRNINWNGATGITLPFLPD